MSWLQFIDSMTGRLAWPLAALVLGLIFRRSLAGLFSRVRTLRWGDTEAELAEINEATEGVQEALRKVATPLPEGHEDSEQERRRRIEALITSAAGWGFTLAQTSANHSLPPMSFDWDADSPSIRINDSVTLSDGTRINQTYIVPLDDDPDRQKW